jgi:hypothetical protein
MTTDVYFAAFFFPSLAFVLIYLMKYIAAVKQARVRADSDDDYRALALKLAASQAEVSAQLADVQARLAGLEKILKEVE